MNVLTVVSPFRNYRMKLLELMSLTSVSMTLALGIMDEPETNAAETNAVSSLSALIIAVNIVFALCTLFEVVAEVRKKIRKRLRTKELWKTTWRKKKLLVAILKRGSPQCCSSSSDDNSTAQKRRKTNQAESVEGGAIEMTDLHNPEQRTITEDFSRTMSDMITFPMECGHGSTGSRLMAPIDESSDDINSIGSTSTMDVMSNSREFSVCKSEPEGETYYMDNETGETTWELPDDAIITEEEESTLDLGQAPQPPEDPPCEDAPQRRRQFCVSVTEGGDEYFINNETQETTWYLPEDGEIVEI